MNQVLTYHAKERVAERTKMDEDEVLAILGSHQHIVVGIEPFTDKVHKLYYSIVDESHFVAVQNNSTGEVVTVLPIEFRSYLDQSIPDKKIREAVFRVSPEMHDEMYPDGICTSLVGLNCEIMAVINTFEGGSTKISLGNHQFADPCLELIDALADPVFAEKVLVKLCKRRLDVSDVEEIVISNKRSDFYVVIPWEFWEPFDEITPDMLGEIDTKN